MTALSRHRHEHDARRHSLLRSRFRELLVVSTLILAVAFPTSSFAQDTTTTAPTTTVPATFPPDVDTDIDTELPGATTPPNTTPTKQETVAQEQARTANKTLDKATKALLDAQLAVDATSLEIQTTRALLAELEAKIEVNEALLAIRQLPLNQLSRIIKKRAVTMYQNSGSEPTDPVEKFYYMRETALSSTAQQSNVEDLETFNKKQKALKKIEKDLDSQKTQAVAKDAELQTLSVQFSEQLEIAKKEYEKNASKFLDAYALVGARLAVDGKMCPIAGPMTHVQDWGNPRSGGRRHKGNDLFNAFGTPNVAIIDGVIRQTNSGLGGMGVLLSGTDGNLYYYAHLSAFAGGPRAVKQGEVIGYTGDSGNARGGAPHTHFEIRLGGSQHIDPYPTLRIICGV
jgi:murein DD-endopeptidase MepM/ murein hydrolase activator NlpD